MKVIWYETWWKHIYDVQFKNVTQKLERNCTTVKYQYNFVSRFQVESN